MAGAGCGVLYVVENGVLREYVDGVAKYREKILSPPQRNVSRRGRRKRARALNKSVRDVPQAEINTQVCMRAYMR